MNKIFLFPGKNLSSTTFHRTVSPFHLENGCATSAMVRPYDTFATPSRVRIMMLDMDITGKNRASSAVLVSVIGVIGDRISLLEDDARNAVESAECLLGSTRLIELAGSMLEIRKHATLLRYEHDLNAVLNRIADMAAHGTRVAVLASGDPGFFGVLRAIARVIDRESIEVFPALSSISIAFSRVRIPWDDAVVVSMHGRPVNPAVARILASSKVAILTSPETPPQVLARKLIERNARVARAFVCTNLCTKDELVMEAALDALAEGDFDPYAVIILTGMNGIPLGGYMPAENLANLPGEPTIGFGMDAEFYRHKGNLITKDEIRAIVLSKLELPRYGVLWDVGSGSGSVAIEAALLSPGLTVFAIDRDEEAIANIQSNALSHEVQVHAVHGHAPEVFSDLPAPDRVFVGGGKISVLEAAVPRVQQPGRVVATYVALDRAARAAEILGSVIQVSVSGSTALPDGTLRLVPHNPVFVAYGNIDQTE
ncbi:MAG: precorrin-6y C5,15-methyltransferase (decarboxylating) subunit CbiE [Acidimicrobiales bacterium]